MSTDCHRKLLKLDNLWHTDGRNVFRFDFLGLQYCFEAMYLLVIVGRRV